MNSEDMKSFIRKLRELARRKPLSHEDLDRAKQLMMTLKGMGFTSLEISKLSKGWSEASVKVYTRGAKVQDSNIKDKAVTLLGDLIERDLNLDDVEFTLGTMRNLDARGLTIDDASVISDEALAVDIPAKDVVSILLDLRAAGLTVADVVDVLSTKVNLDKAGLKLADLPLIVEASRKFGGVDEILKAVNTYGSLTAVEAQLADASAKAGQLTQVITEKDAKIEGQDRKIAENESTLNSYHRLLGQGFDETTLAELETISKKFGGAKNVLAAVETFATVQELKDQEAELRKKIDEKQTDFKGIEAKYAHLMPIVAMCDTLLFRFGLTTDAIGDILRLAKLHGEPNGVIRALGKYGEIKRLQDQIDELQATIDGLGERKVFLQGELTTLRDLLDELKKVAKGILKPFTNDLTSNAELLRQNFSATMNTIFAKCSEFIQRFGEAKGEAGKLEEELKLARFIMVIVMHPSEAKSFPIDYAHLFLDCVSKLLRAKDLNPKVKAGDWIKKRSLGIESYAQIDLLDLLAWVARDLPLKE